MSENPFSSPAVSKSSQPDGVNVPPQKPHRPASVTVFGILNLIFGGLGICGSGAGLVGFLLVEEQPENALQAALSMDVVYSGYTNINIGLGFLVSILLIVAGIFLLKQKNLGRTLSNVYGVYGIISVIIGLGIIIVYVRPKVMPIVENGIPVGAITFWLSIGGVLLGLVYPILLLIFMNQNKVKQALN